MKNFLVLLVISVSFLFFSCGEKKTESPLDQLKEKAQDMENLGEQMKDFGEGFKDGKKVNPVDFRELKTLLPENLGSLKRTSIEGEKVNAMGMNISHADANYSDQEGNQSINLKITDLGTISGLSGLAAYGWYMVDIDQETETGYERTFNYKGNKGFEKYDNQSKYGEVSVLIAKRFAIEANGNNITMDQIKNVLNVIDIGKLESLKDFGIEN